MRLTRAWPLITLLAAVGSAAACRIVEKYPTTSIPDDARLVLRFDCDTTATTPLQKCLVTGIVFLSTNDGAGAGWTVDLSVTNGSFIGTGADTLAKIRRLVTDGTGSFSAMWRAPADTATARFTASAHAVTQLANVKVVQPDAFATDSPPVTAIKLSPDTAKIKKGDSVLVSATFLDANGKALPSRRAYFSTDNKAKATVSPGPADKMWVKGLDTGTTTLHASRLAILSAAPIVVSP